MHTPVSTWKRLHSAVLDNERKITRGQLAAEVGDKNSRDLPDYPTSAKYIPPLYQLERKMTASNRKCAIGEDCIPDWARKEAPCEFAALYHPLLVKSAMQVQEPVHWKGGIMASFLETRWENRQSRSLPRSATRLLNIYRRV